MSNMFKNKKGMALIITLIVMMILFIFGAAYLTSMISETGIARNQEKGEQAFFVAEAGLDRGIRVLLEAPDTDALPWTLQENMNDGYYSVTAAEDLSIGAGFVRITSTGFVGNASRITEVIVYIAAWKYLLMSDTDISFGPTANGTVDGDIHANGSVIGLSVGTGIDYVDTSRRANNDEDVMFQVRNNTGSSVSLTNMTVSWTSPSAYYEQVRIRILGGSNYGTVWNRSDIGNIRAASGQKINFRMTVDIPSGSVAEIRIDNFRRNQTGGSGGNRDMDNTTFNVSLWETSTEYTTSIPLAGVGSNINVTGAITQGVNGDPLVMMPVVDMGEYLNSATEVVYGDYTFDGNDGFVDRTGNWYEYRREIYYITGKAIINDFFHNLFFRNCVIVAEGGIEIVTKLILSGIDYVSLSRSANTNEDVIFQVQNTTGADVTITEMTIAWSNPDAYYEHIDFEIINGADYGTVLDFWDINPWYYRLSSGQKVNLSTSVIIPNGETAEIQLRDFRRRRSLFQGGDRNRDMDNTSFTVTFWAGPVSYTTTVLEAGEVISPSGGRLRFRRWNPYPALITKTGDIIEQDSTQDSDRDFDGIIYSQEGMVSFENLRLDGAIVANSIALNLEMDLDYRPRFVADPPPDFIAGLSLLNWQENQ